MALKILPYSNFRSPALIVPFPTKVFPNKLPPNMCIKILRVPPFRSFVSFSIDSLTSCINKSDFSRDLTYFINLSFLQLCCS